MATFTITNISSADVHLGDFYTTLVAGQVLTLADRSPNEIPDLKSVIAQLAAGTITFAVAYSAAEIASGMMSPPNAVQAGDFNAVAAADVESPVIVFHKSFTDGGVGAADDVVVVAANALPYKLRILDVVGLITTNVAGSTLAVHDEAAGAGTAVASLDTATTGRKVDTTATAGLLITPAATKGIFLRRSDDGIEGEVLIFARREA